MDDGDRLLQWIEQDRDSIVQFLSGLLQAKSPNPPGDTNEAASYVARFLEDEGLPHAVVAPNPEMPNVVGAFECRAPGRHLVLNGHLDVFPVGNETWIHDPWGGDVADGYVHGRGASDMKAGMAASVFAYAYVHRVRARLCGRLTLTAVSDEETLGPWGARYLIEHHPEVHGDCLLNGEPSGPQSMRFAEKGSLWLGVLVRTPGAHGAYVHKSKSSTKLAYHIASELEDALTVIEPTPPSEVSRALAEAREATDSAQGPGAYETVKRITVGIGTVHGGLKVNMIASECRLELDIRLPVGTDMSDVMLVVTEVMSHHPEALVTSCETHPPSLCSPAGPMVEILRASVRRLRGFEPTPIVSLGGTDARLWRYRGIPAYVYGVPPRGVGSVDECVSIEDYLHVVRTHVLSAYEYLRPA